jgi:uncharacterized repeat protein (TIGR01451 family)
MKTRARIARLITTGVAVVGLLVGGMATASPVYAADSVSISPSSRTVTSNTLATYTLTYSCSTTGNCVGATITIPTNNVTGNGANTDFSAWVSAGTCPSLTKTAGLVTFNLGTVLTGTYSCNFTVRAPNKTTLNGATATLTPTFTSSGGSFTATTPATLTLTAGHNVGMGSGVNPTSVLSGANMVLTFSLACGSSQTTPNGDLGLSALSLTDVLPANFTFTGISTAPASLPGTFTLPPVGSSGGTVSYVGDGSECLNPANNRLVFTVQGTASTNGVPDAVGEKICHTASASFTYIDGVTGTAAPTPASPCATVIDIDWRTGKTVTPKTMANRGQYKAIDNTVPPLYTFPGDWDGGATTSYDITVNTSPTTTNSGLSYDIKDPLPCLDNVSGAKYLSNAPGVACANPAYIPRVITVTGFTPPAGALLTLLRADGSTSTVPYVAGTGWTLPTSPAVSEIDFPPFTQEGNNNFGVITFHVTGYAAPAAAPGYILSNTTTVDAYFSGTSTPVKTTQHQSANILVADPALYGDGANMYASATSTYSGSCVARIQLQGSGMEITQAPSQAIYIDYLAPAGVGALTIPPLTLTLTGGNGKTFTATGVTVANQVTNYNGTGRTLIEWTIPAGLATQPGLYTVSLGGFDVNLGAGCAGTFQNAMTIGYGSTIPSCAVAGVNQTPPALPAGDTALDTNGSPIAGNFCGASAPLSVTATNPGFTVDKLVQGNLDATQIGAGGTGHVSADGGAATYTISFTNTGLSTLRDPVMYDLLPRIGDTRASSTAPRDSEFPVFLTGIGTLPANLTVAYSQATNPCRPEVLTPNAGCVDDWSTTPPSPLSSTTALRFSYTGNVAVSAGFSASYTVSTPATTAGDIAWNSIGTNVFAGDTLFGKAESSLTGLQAQSAQPAITKVADRSTVSAVGDEIVFTFTVTNNTAVTLANVGVSDALVNSASSSVAPAATCTALSSPAASCSGATTTLLAGQSAVFTASYVTTQADLDHGSISDIGTASATPPTGPALSNSSDVVTVTATQNPALALAKSANPTVVSAVGDTVEYTFTVTNSGNVTLDDLAIDEQSFSGSGSLSAIECPSAPLAPTQSVDCVASYPVSQADLTAGVIDNTARATATSPSGVPVASASSSASVDVEQQASLSLVKSVTPTDDEEFTAGQLISYTFVVSNTGNVPVTGISIAEVSFSGTGPTPTASCPVTSLDPGDQVTCTASYTLTQADVDSLALVNTANATGTAPSGPVTSNDSTVTTPQTPMPRLVLTKSADTAFVNAAGDVVSYLFVVRNTGNVTVHDIAIDETAFSGTGAPAVSCSGDVLIPGQELECTADYTVTQADMNQGSIVNTARATGLDPTDGAVASATSTWTVTANVAPALTLVKSADVASYDTVGAAIEFAFEVTNTGNVLLTGVSITEGVFTGSGTLGGVSCPSDELTPGASMTCHADYEATQADLDHGSIANTATAFGFAPNAVESTTSAPSTARVDAVQSPELGLVKSVTPTTVDAAGEPVTYEFLVSNTGNVTLTDLAIDETAFTGTGALADADCGATPLAPGDERTCLLSYQVTQADVDAGVVDNTAVATASLGATEVASDASSASLTIEREPAISLVKSASPAAPADFHAGETITYSFVITNTGNVTLTDIDVVEGDFTGTGALADPTCASAAPLAPGEQRVCSTEYVVRQEDIDAASITNAATATGTPPAGLPAPESPASSVTVPEPANPGLALVKSTNTTSLRTVGQIVTYSFAVTNTGNTTATGIAITEDAFTGHGELPVAECPAGAVLPGQTVTCTARYSVIAADLAGAALSNTAVATSATPAGGAVASAPSSATIADVADLRDPLAFTGLAMTWGSSALALGLVALGVVLLVVRRRRTAE